MNGEIEKNFKKANILKFVLFGIDAVCVFVTFFGIFYFDNFVLYPYMVLLLGVLFWITIFYLFKLYPICKSVRLLNKYKLQDTSDDLETKSFNLQRSKIFIGSKAKKLILLSHIIWFLGYISGKQEYILFLCLNLSSFNAETVRDSLSEQIETSFRCYCNVYINFHRI